MAKRKPLVMVNGQIQQLQSTDSISAAEIPQYTNGEAGAIAIGSPVYISGNDTVMKAKANASGTLPVIGVVADGSIANGVAGGIQDTGTLVSSGGFPIADSLTLAPLTANVIYYASVTTAGTMTANAPSAAGQYVQEIGIATSTTELKLTLRAPVLL